MFVLACLVSHLSIRKDFLLLSVCDAGTEICGLNWQGWSQYARKFDVTFLQLHVHLDDNVRYLEHMHAMSNTLNCRLLPDGPRWWR
jgi:hypothetical protein